MTELPARITAAVDEAKAAGNTTPTRIAADCGVSLSTLSRWMNGSSEPTWRQIQLFSVATGKPLEYFAEVAA